MERNYVIINGVNSTSINGLYIKDLPPITKPLMRNTKEEIDGRDGDIITKLGYSAYDKTITIGLAGDYDINEVISFFNPEPQEQIPLLGLQPTVSVTFSNEPEYYYRCEILEQIDFNALLKFKTATVKFHCQPFKYKEENAIDGTTSLSVTNSGNIYAKPVIYVIGAGTIDISLNNSQVFSVECGENGSWIIIATEYLQAYEVGDGFTISLANRKVSGDYSTFKLPVGSNTITFSGGTISETAIQNYSRWI